MPISALIRRKPFLSFGVVCYGVSWAFWLSALWLPNPVAAFFYYLGGFGPLIAALLILKIQGRSLRAWSINLFKWRCHPGWYLFALGFPVLLIVIVSLIYLLLGNSLDVAVLPDRLVAYLPTLLLLACVGGGNEEPGWRGFGLPVLQQRYRPVAATCILGVVWAVWHLPLLAINPDVASGALDLWHILMVAGVTLVSITTHAFWYTWLINKTGSVLLCILLHASYNAANGLLLLVPDAALRGRSYQLLLVLMTGVLLTSVVGLLARTKGQLGAAYGTQA